MSSNFLQRFKGKTQTVTKEGVHDILGGRDQKVPVYTHSNGISILQKTTHPKTSSTNPSKKKQPEPPKRNQSMNRTSSTVPDSKKNKNTPLHPPKDKESSNQYQNPFLVSNPFYLDEEQRERAEKEKLEKQKLARLEGQANKVKEDPKKGTYGSAMRRSSQNKKGEKEWVKLGGLGPNIGGEEWEERRKKHQKMQEFASQVKAINSLKPPRQSNINQKKQETGVNNARKKALEYSKNIPKPVVKSHDRQGEPQEQQEENYGEREGNQLSELQLYEMRHQQLQQMLRREL